MPEAKKEEEKTVDIDSSGPDTEVEIKDDKEKEPEVIETPVEPEKPVEEKQEASDEKQETKEEKPVEEKDDKKQELEQYSEGVQKRIAKLTKNGEKRKDKKKPLLISLKVFKQNILS